MKHRDKMVGLRKKSVEELREQIHESRKGYFEMRSRSASMQVANPNQFSELKKDIARCLTLISEKEREGQPPSDDIPKAAGRRRARARLRRQAKAELARPPRKQARPAKARPVAAGQGAGTESDIT